jgi:P-type Cu+ transporter
MSECAYCHASFQSESLFCCHSCELLSTWVNEGMAPVVAIDLVSAKWQKYNAPELEDSFNFSKCPVFKKFRFYVDGLQCSSCVHLLEDFHLYCDQVASVHVNFASGVVDVQTKKEMGLGNLCAAIEQLGYYPTPFKESLEYENARKADVRNDLIRIGVAGAIAGNLMLFSVPIYAGLEGQLGNIFKWISFFIFLPMVFYVALPFYRKAWTSILVRQISIDMMIVVALLAGFIFSTYSLAVGSNEFYFDSTASFIFLILMTRYLVKRLQSKLIHKNIFAELFTNEVFEIKDAEITRLVSFDNILKDQRIRLKKNQLLPCDCVLQSCEAEFDLAFLTGEALPRGQRKLDRVLAGSRLLSESAELVCLDQANSSDLAVSLARIELEAGSKSDIQSLTDLISHRLTMVVFSVAGIFFIFAYQQMGFEAFRRCLALITIACPCAVAFGTPLAHSLALKKATQKGFYIKSDLVFEKLQKVDKIVFDKTGTLTSSKLSLVKTTPEFISDEDRSVIRGLERNSNHPVALTLQSEWGDIAPRAFSEVTETAGVGVQAVALERNYRLQKSKTAMTSESMQVDFLVDENHKATLFFDEAVKPEAVGVIKEFYDKKFKVMILTGDERNRSLRVAQLLGVPGEYVYSEKSPTEKRKIIKNLNPCLFVGDGLNDLEALSEADVSFAIKGTFESTLKVSDIYAPKKDLHSLHEIFALAKTVHHTVKTNLAFAVLYNVIGGSLALTGFINPLVAAILMPISSFLITLNTIWRLK